MNTDHERHARLRSRLLMAAKLAVSATLLVVLFSRVDATQLLAVIKRASVPWLIAGIGLYFANVVVSTWRWRLLLAAQDIALSTRMLLSSFLVATFFNNFLPSNIGGDVIRIRDTAPPAGSTTLATTIVLVDRVIGLVGLILVAAIGATMAVGTRNGERIWASWLWATFAAAVVAPAVLTPNLVTRLLKPLMVLHPEWIGERIDRLSAALERFRQRRRAVAACFTGAVVVQIILVLFYFAVVHALRLPVGVWDLAVVVPISFFVQMVPVSMNGFGVREATFSFFLTRTGLPLESAVLLPLVATALIMVFSLTGAAVYVTRRASGSTDLQAST